MNKLYFKYGAMGSSKTAQALMCRFNYVQKGFNVLLAKPSIDTRSSKVKSRIGLEADCETFSKNENLIDFFEKKKKEQVNELKEISLNIPVLCYGLLTNFKTELFEGSKRLVELSDSLMEIKSVCRCGRKATVNARFVNGKITTTGEEVSIGADEMYEGMCYNCFKKELNNSRGKK